MSKPKQPKLVMVIEDSPLDAHILCNVLKEFGYDSTWVESLEAAYSCLRGSVEEFDAFIIDYQFKGENSTKLIVELKNSIEFSMYNKKPLILVTSIDILSFREHSDYKEHLGKLVGQNIIHKTRDWKQWLQPLVLQLLISLGEATPHTEFSNILAEEKIKEYRKSFTLKRNKEVEITLCDAGISSIVANFSEPKTLEQAMFEIIANAIRFLQTEKEFINLTNTKKAEIIGVHRIKYGRMLREFLDRSTN